MNRSYRRAVFCAAFMLAVSYPVLAGVTQYTLTSGSYTHYTVGPVGCPNCKDGFFYRIDAPAGTTITNITVASRWAPDPNNNHWYRCQVQVACGFEEFSDVNHHDQSCFGRSSCLVWRATDGSTGNENDVINVFWK
jgi:hypothetical protein